MTFLTPILVLAFVAAGVALVWRAASRRRSLPCPSWLSWMVDNPLSKGRTTTTLRQLDLAPGLAVLDAGCGPGRLTIPIAAAIGPSGRVVAMDIQPEMLRRAQEKADRASLRNVGFVRAGLGQGTLIPDTFDRAVLITVLGEIPDRIAALREVYAALKPGAFLLVGEVLGDPHYQSVGRIREMAQAVGFEVEPRMGSRLAFAVRLRKPYGAGSGGTSPGA